MMDEHYAVRVDDVKARAHGRWDEILRHLGVDDAVLSRKNMACPLCGGTDRFQYTDRFGEGNYHCRNPDCGPGRGFKLLQAVMGWDFGTALRKVHDCVGGLLEVSRDGLRDDGAGRCRPLGVDCPDGVFAPAPAAVAQQPVERMRALARRIWDEASPVRAGDAVDRYLTGRGLGLDAYPLALRCHPKLGYYERGQGGKSQRVAEYPAMVVPPLAYTMSPGDIIQAGIVISNSEVGHGTLSVQPLMFRVLCSNGLIVPERALRKAHVGRALGGEEDALRIFQEETLRADDRAFFLKVRDVVQATVSEKTFLESARKLQRTMDVRLTGDPVKSVEVLANRFDLSDNERSGVLRHLISGGDLSGYGLVNAVTHFSQEVDDYDRATAFEELGGKLIELSRHEWDGIAEAS